jgi:multidrug efflux pump subunit AcrB
MKNLAKYSVEKAITVFMVVIIVAVFGVVSFTRLTTDLFPSMNIPYAVVVTTYIGASPTEVEENVSKPLEETFATTTNVKNLTSTSQENVSIIFLEFESDTNMDSAMIEMREDLDMVISGLPDEVGSPMIIKINPDMMPVFQFSVSKEGLTQQELSLLVEEDILPNIERIGGVASVSISGAYNSEISVVIDEEAIADINTQISAGL